MHTTNLGALTSSPPKNAFLAQPSHVAVLLAQRDASPSPNAFWERMLIDANRLERAPTIEAGRFMEALGAVLRDTPGIDCAELRLRCYFHLVTHLHYTEQLGKTVAPVESMLRLSSAFNDTQLSRRAHNLAGLLLAIRGCNGAAIQQFLAAWGCARRLDDKFRGLWVALHIAIVVGMCGQFASARGLMMRILNKANQMPDEEQHGHLVGACIENLVCLALESAGDDEFEVLAEMTMPLQHKFTLQDATMHIERCCTNARLHMVTGQLDKASAMLSECESSLKVNSSSFTELNYCLALGLMEVLQGRVDIGFSRLHDALERIGENRLRLRDAFWTMRYAYTFVGDSERAQHYADCSREMRAFGSEGVMEQFSVFMQDFDVAYPASQRF